MQIEKSIVIDRPAAEVWQLMAHEFEHADLWIGAVKKSYSVEDPRATGAAPVSGRVCEFSHRPGGMSMHEVITDYDEQGRTLTVEVTPMNAPSLMPIRGNVVQMAVQELGPEQAKVTWLVTPNLKLMGRMLSPLMKVGLGNAFGKVLKELKVHSESRVRTA